MKSVLLLFFFSFLAFSETDLPRGFFQGNMGNEDIFSASEAVLIEQPILDSNYLLGPGDLISLYIGKHFKTTISPEGFLHIKDFKPIYLNHVLLFDAKKIIKSKLSASYDTSKIYIHLIRPRKHLVHVLGEVQYPGSYPVSATTKLTPVVQGTLFKPTSIREYCTLIKIDGTKLTVNLSDYFTKQDERDVPTLEMGDRIYISAVDFEKPFCTILTPDSLTQRIQFHQIQSKLTLKEIAFQMANYSKTPEFNQIKINSTNGGVQFLNGPKALLYIPVDGDTIEIAPFSNRVFVGGEVKNPGFFNYIKSYNVVDYLFHAGILVESKEPVHCEVYRMGNLLNESQIENGILPGDKIYLHRRPFYVFRDYLGVISSIAGIITSIILVILTIQ